jgi:hypothetical protein
MNLPLLPEKWTESCVQRLLDFPVARKRLELVRHCELLYVESLVHIVFLQKDK